MLLRLHPRLAPEQLQLVLETAAELGLHGTFEDANRSLMRLTGEPGPAARSRFADLAVVKAVLEFDDAPELHERQGRADLEVRIGEARFGGGHVAVAAGPCAVENLDRLVEVALAARNAGATLLRGGAYKPRTSPHSFQGLGERGLELLAEARAVTGLPVVTEVLDPRDIERVGAACDMFQVGARSMGNSALLSELGAFGKPVLLKRGIAATVREFLLAAEYVLLGGNEQVILCERGIRSFDTTTRNVLDLGAVAHLKRATHLPVVVDPSHAAGRSDLVRPLARAGIAVGADGLLVETHPLPHLALSDGSQAISEAEFQGLMADVEALVGLDGRTLSKPDTSRAGATPVRG